MAVEGEGGNVLGVWAAAAGADAGAGFVPDTAEVESSIRRARPAAAKSSSSSSTSSTGFLAAARFPAFFGPALAWAAPERPLAAPEFALNMETQA